MVAKPADEKLRQKIKALEKKNQECRQELKKTQKKLAKLEGRRNSVPTHPDHIQVSGINIEWNTEKGICTFENLPVAMMWVDTTLVGLMAGLQSMVGAKRFSLALQSEGRKSVETDWQVISQFPDFQEGFKAIANIAAVAGWGDWKLVSLDEKKQECIVRAKDSWEGRYQKTLGVCWSSGMLAGKMAGYISKLFGTNCWADQTAYICEGDDFDEFVIHPSNRSIEEEIENLLSTDEATRADIAVALQKLRKEFSERVRTEKRLRQSKERLRILFEYAPDPIYISALDGVLADCNYAAEEFVGYKREELIGSDLFAIGIISDSDLPKALEIFKQNQEGKRTGPEEFTLNHKSGEQLFAEISTHPVNIGDEKFVLGIARDISERKRVEAERSRLEAQLRQVQKMEAVGTLAGGIAHDFNNILSALIGYTELALAKTEKGAPLREDLGEVLTAGLRARDLVKQILTFSRQAEQKMQPVQMNLIVKETLKFLRSSLPSSIEIRPNIASDARVMADPTQIHQVLMNLCTNAKHAMRETGGVLEVSVVEVQLDADFADANPGVGQGLYLILEVADNGEGISAEVLEKIFDPFFTTKNKQEGTGLGLAVVHGIVKNCGGLITVSSKPGKGATFKVYLPVVAAQNRPQAEVKGPLPTGSERVLFVDDEKPLADIGKEMLGRYGYRVTSRTSSVEALELFKAKPDHFDLLITDMTMPNMSGLELTREIININPNMPVILCTGFSEKITEKSAKAVGIKAFLMKPVAIDDLTRAVRKVLEQETVP